MQKKYQIFISSTYTDLFEARQKVIDTILSLFHFPAGMELFSADDDDQWQVIKETIDVSDYYVVIIGHRYGSIASDGMGYTEKEYDYAREKGIPVYAFIRERDVATKKTERDDDPDLAIKLEMFIDKAKANKMCDNWTSTDELATKVSVAISKAITKKPGIGWIRGDSVDHVGMTEELTILSKENRELREELARLQSLVVKQKPSIVVSINDKQTIEISYLSTKTGSKRYDKAMEYEDIPGHLKKYISPEQLEEYNKSLPEEEIIDKYYEEFKLYARKKDANVDISVLVFNDGTAKANDIYVDIEFPDEILVIERNEIKRLEPPEELDIPESPLSKANREYQKQHPLYKTGLLSEKYLKMGAFANINQNFSSSFGLETLVSSTRINMNHKVYVEDNSITIKISNLMHTRQHEFDEEFSLVPLKTGDFQAKVTIICEEYEKPEVQYIDIHVKS